ncbi:helix-turn-helix domain-containing protein [Pseudarthrobacter sp. H2]|uniref:helix-turn-helix domain-containing protein n=1 Tax=Pseudarthrobacter sp. H2 TaxID=3418415 RepID=UPI003CE70167
MADMPGRNDVFTGMASVQKAFALLDGVASDQRGLTAKEIAATLEIPLTTVYRRAPQPRNPPALRQV